MNDENELHPRAVLSSAPLGVSLIERLREGAADDDYTRHDGTAGTTVRAAAMREAANEIERLREALDQLLDDMGAEGHCVCEAAKQQAIEAMTPNV